MTNTESRKPSHEAFVRGAATLTLATIDYRIASLPEAERAIAADTLCRLNELFHGFRLLSCGNEYLGRSAWHYIQEGDS